MSLAYINEACTIYCEGPVLNAVQLSQIYNDSKTFVDMPMRFDPNVTLAAFNALADPSDLSQLRQYLDAYFLPAGSDLAEWVPTDFTDSPAFLTTITDMDYQSWASDLNQLWLILGRQVNESVHENPQRHSYVPRNYPMMVPGGRFRESYYWDSWWIVRGLLVCDMNVTAQNVINNLLDDVGNFGFVPNGGRIYYLDRSQPPLLSDMIVSYTNYMFAQGIYSQAMYTYLTDAFETLLVEYSFWMSAEHGHIVDMPPPSSGSAEYRLNRYYSNYTTPRPESYLEDYDNAHASQDTLEDYYHQVRAGAETGWDFSSRWIRESPAGVYNITNIHTNEVVPIDLNSILYKFETNMVYIANLLSAHAVGDDTTVGYYNDLSTDFTSAASVRLQAINEYLWDGAGKHWRDYNLTSGMWTHYTAGDATNAYLRNSDAHSDAHSDAPAAALSASSISNYSTVAYWVPLWAGILPSDGTTADDLVASLQRSGILQAAGVLTTTIDTGLQWDAPDSWAPEVMFTIEGLQVLNTQNSLNLAVSMLQFLYESRLLYTFLFALRCIPLQEDITQRWLNTCYIAYNRTQYMYEKYNAFEVGVGGGGGEYKPQVGFGWSNAVALLLLQETYLPTSHNDSSDDGLTEAQVIVIACIAAFVTLAAGILLYLHVYYPVGKTAAAEAPRGSATGVNLSPISPTTTFGSMQSKSALEV
jgi:alpha,alpha-trehalase